MPRARTRLPAQSERSRLGCAALCCATPAACAVPRRRRNSKPKRHRVNHITDTLKNSLDAEITGRTVDQTENEKDHEQAGAA